MFEVHSFSEQSDRIDKIEKLAATGTISLVIIDSLTMFYRLLPTLITEGRVYIAESPLYEIKIKDNKSLFAYNEPEKAEIVSRLDEAGTKYVLQRSKGLGENEPEMMWETTMNPETRRLIRVSKADAEQTAYIFETLLGDDLPARKEFITVHGSEYMNDVDAY